MNISVDNHYWMGLLSIVQRSYAIENHLEFFNWLQHDVNEFLPHDVLLACWGDFDENVINRQLSYDVASNFNEVSTQIVHDANVEFDECLYDLHQLWLNNKRCWYVINNLQHNKLKDRFNISLPNTLDQLNSLMVYGVSDIRGNNVCLYVFLSKAHVFEVPSALMGLIMPHIDTVLRKIQHLKPLKISMDSSVIGGESELTVRELEIIHWIKFGKTNLEIASILDISQNTVKSHLKRVFQKMNVVRRAQAVAILLNKPS